VRRAGQRDVGHREAVAADELAVFQRVVEHLRQRLGALADLAMTASSRWSAGMRTSCRKAWTIAGLNVVVCQSIQRSAEARALTSDGHSVSRHSAHR
jgi:hypothetical protein